MICIFCDKLQTLDDLPAAELVARFEHSYALLGQYQYYTGYQLNQWYYDPYKYFPHNYAPAQSPRWPEAQGTVG